MQDTKVNNKPERIQKLIAKSGLCSRREAELKIQEGNVRVNGKTAQIGDKADPEATIFVNNKPIKKIKQLPITLIMNKPKGVHCTNSDRHTNRTVFDLLPPQYKRQRLFCAGRLDKDSEGLLVLTNDGDLSHRLTHPSKEIIKRYRVVLHRDFKKEDLAKLLNGVEYEGDFLKAEKVILAPAEGENYMRRLEVHLHHGKKREIRRLFEVNHYYVKKLVRVQIGGIILRNLPRAGFKILDKKDIERLFA